jgi:four helix bundle protein
MINNTNRRIDIHERIYGFVLQILKILSKLPKNSTNIIIVDQCGRSVTSVGANDQEADACESRKDFIAKYSIAKKEMKETNYWLRLIKDTNSNLNIDSAQQEGKELLLIISSIIKNSRK